MTAIFAGHQGRARARLLAPEHFPIPWNRKTSRDLYCIAFSSREPVSTSLENALGAAFLFFFVLTSVVWADDAKVGIDNFAFTPAVLTVKPGTTVVFENHDDIPHLVVDVAGKFRSKALDSDDKFSITFDKPGEIAYFCGLHPHMKGKIIVAP
jgi:plastocyanin